jgi:hypothetical protein
MLVKGFRGGLEHAVAEADGTCMPKTGVIGASVGEGIDHPTNYVRVDRAAIEKVCTRYAAHEDSNLLASFNPLQPAAKPRSRSANVNTFQIDDGTF